MANVVLSGVSEDAGVQGSLFEGIKFWLSQKVPQRSRFVNDVKANGGAILPIEKHADVKIVDHARKEQQPGTHSYTFIERSVRHGVLEDLADHAVGPPEGTIRSVGSVTQPAKSTRTKFSVQDDAILRNWVAENPQKSGGTKGREIYIQLQAKFPQHTWQSWRDRYVKHLSNISGPAPLPLNAPPTPPSDQPSKDVQAERARQRSDEDANEPEPFSEEDAQALLLCGEDILDVAPESVTLAWQEWAKHHDTTKRHTAEAWRSFWEENVRRRFLKRQAKKVKQTSYGEKRIKSEPRSPTRVKAEDSRSMPALSTLDHVAGFTNSQSRSPSYTPESPHLHVPEPSHIDGLHNSITILESPMKHDLALNSRSFTGKSNSLKRRLISGNDDVTSSYTQVKAQSTKRTKGARDMLAKEIASTPDRSPDRPPLRQPSPLFIEEDEELSLSSKPVFEDYALSDRLLGQSPPGPDRIRETTQAVFREPTPLIDFDVARPEGGWGEGDLQTIDDIDLALDDDFTISQVHDPPPDTQGILQSHTQVPDFSLSEPEGGWNMPSSPPRLPSSPHAESVGGSDDTGTELDAWIAGYVAEGFTASKTRAVLKCCSLDSALAENVLESIGVSGDIPRNWKGVWTDADDEDLQSTDARKIIDLEEKHGKDFLRVRWDFMRFYMDN